MTLLIVYLAIAIGVSFVCSVLEAVLLSITPSFVAKTQSERPRLGAKLLRVKERLDESLSSILIFNTGGYVLATARLAGGLRNIVAG